MWPLADLPNACSDVSTSPTAVPLAEGEQVVQNAKESVDQVAIDDECKYFIWSVVYG
jgi:hypothetical protein